MAETGNNRGSGTVIRISSGGGKGHRRKRKLIVAPGSFDKSNGRDEFYKSVFSAMRSGKKISIEEYPPETDVGDNVSYEIMGDRRGKYWPAKIVGYNPSAAKPSAKSRQLSELELQVMNLPNLPESRRKYILPGLNFLINDIENNWAAEPINKASYHWTKSATDMPVMVVYKFDDSDMAQSAPMANYVRSYVERGLDLSQWRDCRNALRAYQAITCALYPRTRFCGIGNFDSIDDVRSAEYRLGGMLREGLDQTAIDRLKAWVKRQENVERMYQRGKRKTL